MGELRTDWVSRHKLTVDDYYRLGEVGILGEDDRVELIAGEIIDMAPMGSRHAGIINKIARLLRGAGEDFTIIAVQNPIRLSNESEPQPDVALLRPRADCYFDKHPEPSDVFLIIEVADTSLRYDREIKVPLYARHDISETWLVDIESRTVTVYSEPHNGAYQRVTNFDLTATISPRLLPDLTLDIAALF